MSMVTTTFLKLPRMRVIPKIMVSLTHRYLLQIGLQQPSNQVFNNQPPLKFLIKTLKTMKRKFIPQKSSSSKSILLRPPICLITKVSNMLPYSNTDQELDTYWASKLLIKYPPMGLITKISKMLPYSNMHLKLGTYWASGILLELLLN